MNKKILWVSGLALAASANASLSGYVKTVENAAVSGVHVVLQSTSTAVSTDDNGYFNFDTGDQHTLAMASVQTHHSISLAGDMIQLNLTEATAVRIGVYDLMGNKVSGVFQRLSAGSYSVSPFAESLSSGFYVVRVNAGSNSKTFSVKNAGGKGVKFVGSNGALAKTLSVADSLVFVYNGAQVGSVAIWDDDAQVDDVIFSHKVISGTTCDANLSVVSTESSAGDRADIAPTVSGGSYTATTNWSLLNSARTWTISAGGKSVSGVSDATQNVTLNVDGCAVASSSSVAASSETAATSSETVAATSTNLSFNATLEVSSTDYASTTVDLGASQVAAALGITTSQLSNVTYYGVDPSGSLSNTASTANDPGHWFDANGNIVSYGDDAVVFSELNLSSMTATVGQYPSKMTSGKSYTIKQAVAYGDNYVYFTINVTATGSSAVVTSSSSQQVVVSSSSQQVTASSSSVAATTTITMASLATSDPEVYKFVNWEWTYRLSASGIVEGSDGTYDDYRTQNSSGLSFEHIINGKGTLKYCVVWEKKEALSKSKRDQIRQMLIDITHAWTDYLTGFEGWPYSDVNVVATGWAVYDASYIQDKQSDENVYTTTKTDGMVGEYYTLNFGGNTQPYCADGTYDEIFQVVDGYTSYSTNSWGFAGGGLWVAAEHVESMLGVGIPHIVAHESGHNFGLPDYYESWDFPDANYSSPKSGTASDGVGIIANASYSGNAVTAVMNAGSATSVTKYDYWLLRKFWYETKSKYGY